MKKIGLICLALVLAMGALGVGYAAWTDTVTIDGTVDTGSVELGIVKATGTLYQDKDVATVGFSFVDPIGLWECSVPPGAQAYAYEKLVVTIAKAFPCLTVDIAFYVGSLGTIPTHLQEIKVSDPTGELTFLKVTDPQDPNKLGYFYDTGDAEKEAIITVSLINLVSTQLHRCGADKADLILHVEQPAEQNHTYSFLIEIVGVQWAE